MGILAIEKNISGMGILAIEKNISGAHQKQDPRDQEILSGGFTRGELKCFGDFLKACVKKGQYCCPAHKDGRLTFDGITSGTIRVVCNDKDGCKHSFNPLSHWYMLSNVEVSPIYKKVWKHYTDNFPPPPDKVVTVRPCPERYLAKAGTKRIREDPNSPDKTLPLSPSGKTHFEEGILACQRGLTPQKSRTKDEFLHPRKVRRDFSPAMTHQPDENSFKNLEHSDQEGCIFEEEDEIEEIKKITTPVSKSGSPSIENRKVISIRTPSPLSRDHDELVLGDTFVDLVEENNYESGPLPWNEIVTAGGGQEFPPLGNHIEDGTNAPKPGNKSKNVRRKLTPEEANWIFAGKDPKTFGKESRKLKMLYFLNLQRNKKSLIRNALFSYDIAMGMIIDIGFVGKSITSILTPSDYANELKEKLLKHPTAVFLEEFDPLSIKYMRETPRYKDMSDMQLREEALKLARNRLIRQANALPSYRKGTYNFIMMQANLLTIPYAKGTEKDQTKADTVSRMVVDLTEANEQ